RRVESRHVCNGLCVLTLTDGQVHHYTALGPAARAIPLVVIVYTGREGATILPRQVDAAALVHVQIHTARKHPAQADLPAKLVEVNVARSSNGASEVHVSVPLTPPTAPVPATDGDPAIARHRHTRVELHDPELEAKCRG